MGLTVKVSETMGDISSKSFWTALNLRVWPKNFSKTWEIPEFVSKSVWITLILRVWHYKCPKLWLIAVWEGSRPFRPNAPLVVSICDLCPMENIWKWKKAVYFTQKRENIMVLPLFPPTFLVPTIVVSPCLFFSGSVTVWSAILYGLVPIQNTL